MKLKNKKTAANDTTELTSIIQAQSLEQIRRQSHGFITLMSYYKCAMMEVETKLNVLNEEFSLRFDRNPINSIHSRLKSPVSIEEKLASKNLPMTLQTIEKNLNDIAGVRVITSFVDDIYMLANCLIEQDDVRLIKMKDYIENPKRNGYRSLHLIVTVPIYLHDKKKLMRVEVQFRTIAMDWWASLEHQIRYKKEVAVTKDDAKELRDCAEQAALLDYRMEQLYKSIQGPDA